MKKTEWLEIKNSLIHFYHKTALYYKNKDSTHVLYKDVYTTLTLKRIAEERLPQLYIRLQDREQAVLEIIEHTNKQMLKNIEKGDISLVKNDLVNIASETLQSPFKSTTMKWEETLENLLDARSKNSKIFKAINLLEDKDRNTAVHSVNVMVLTMEFGKYLKLPNDEVKIYGLSSLFHDLGKTEIPNSILKSKRKLNEREFGIMSSHPIKGFNHLKKIDFRNRNILRGALEHHEKLDGSGYPYGKKSNEISNISRILSIVDIYEAVTSDYRPYRDALEPIKALQMLLREQQDGKIDKEYFEKFSYSLVWNV
ncbi:MAG: HD domain-containing protein [Candidatus Cloacimonadota bacterium]|nr:HD domain-containing protein [Candidatus Cloacimonadota bacterium]